MIDQLPHYTHLTKGTWLRLDWLRNISVNDYPKARALDWHGHNELEVIFPVRGNFHYELADGSTINIDGNSFLCIPAGMRHRLWDAIDAPGNRFSLHLNKPTARMRSGVLTAAEYSRIYSRLLGSQCVRINLSPLQKIARSNLWNLLNRPQTGRTGIDAPKIRLLLCLLLCESGMPTEQADERSPNEIILEAKNYLRRNVATNINLEDLVSFIGYSRTRFFSSFKENTGLTPGEYLRNLRIEKAKSLLSETSRTAVDIASECGFGDPAHFCRRFKDMTGFTPLAYRQHKTTLHTTTQ